MTYHRKSPTPKQVIESLLHQGVEVRCYRTKERVTLANFRDLEREHLVELGLKKTDAEKAAVDTPEYWRWSFSAAHAKVTNGTKATSAGSSKHRVAKAVRMEKARLEIPTGLAVAKAVAGAFGIPWPKPQMRGSQFDKTRTKKFRTGEVVPRRERTKP